MPSVKAAPRRVLGNLQPVAQAATNVVSIYTDAIRTGDLNPYELRVALLRLADAAITAEGRVGEVVHAQHREAMRA